MSERELEIGKIVKYLSSKTNKFENPKLVLIGGYALRTYIPFSRYSRDCDFAMKEGIDRIKKIIPANMTLEAFERKGSFAFMRWVKITEIGGKKVKSGVDFMESEIRGRENESFRIDDKFLKNSKKVKLNIGIDCEVFIPDYTDLFLLKVISARRSDIRDIAAMVWKNGIPKNLTKRMKEVTDPKIVKNKVKNEIIPDISDPLFLHSFRGTFVTEEFGKIEQQEAIKKLKSIVF
jgi:hypothetical protein